MWPTRFGVTGKQQRDARSGDAEAETAHNRDDKHFEKIPYHPMYGYCASLLWNLLAIQNHFHFSLPWLTST